MDWISIAIAVVGGAVTLWLKNKNKPDDGGTNPTPVTPGSKTPVIDAILSILRQLVNKPVAGIKATVLHEDGTTEQITVGKENINA